MRLIDNLQLRRFINQSAAALRIHLPYDEADHSFNIAMNLLAGATFLEHLEHRRNDNAYRAIVGTSRRQYLICAAQVATCRRELLQ